MGAGPCLLQPSPRCHRHGMTFDLAVWEGPRPDSDAAAASIYAQLMGRLESEEETPPPSPAIRTFVDTLLARWPDITEDDGDDSPWADGPMIGNASGDAIYFSMIWSMAAEAAAFVAQVAAEQGLVCFDPQSERLLVR